MKINLVQAFGFHVGKTQNYRKNVSQCFGLQMCNTRPAEFGGSYRERLSDFFLVYFIILLPFKLSQVACYTQ